jgi:hypothetical protein
LDEETEAGIYQVEAEETESSEDDSEGGLLIEGEEREYVLELLLRETSLEAQGTNRSACPRPAGSKSKRKESLRKKEHHKRAKVVKEAGSRATQGSGGRTTASGKVKHEPRGQPCNPEAAGGGAAAGGRAENNQPAPPPPTLGRECSA